MFSSRKQEDFLDDIYTQKAAVTNLIQLMNTIQFKQIDIATDIVNKSVYEIDPNEIFKDKDPNFIVKPWEPLSYFTDNIN